MGREGTGARRAPPLSTGESTPLSLCSRDSHSARHDRSRRGPDRDPWSSTGREVEEPLPAAHPLALPSALTLCTWADPFPGATGGGVARRATVGQASFSLKAGRVLFINYVSSS